MGRKKMALRTLLALCALLLCVPGTFGDVPLDSAKKAVDESEALATKNRAKANAIVKQNAEGISDAPCKGKSNCDEDEHPRYTPVKGKSPVMVAKTGKLYAVYNAAPKPNNTQVPDSKLDAEDAPADDEFEKKNKKVADAIVGQNKNGWTDKGPFVMTKALPQSPLHSDDPNDKACTHPNKKMLRQQHMTVRHGDFPTDNTECAEGSKKITRDQLEALVKKHMPLYGGYFIDLC